MKHLLIVLGIFAFAIPTLAAEEDELKELDGVECTHWKDANDDPTLSVKLKYTGEDNDFVDVVVKERFTSQYTHDPLWVTLHKASEQVSTGERAFQLGIDAIVMEIDRPIPAKSPKKPNATIDLGNSISVPLYCEKR